MSLDFFCYLENQTLSPFINDFYFSRGLFSISNQEYVEQENGRFKVVDHTNNFSDYGDPLMNIIPGRKEIKLSKIASLGMKINESYMIIGDKFVTNIYAAALPKVYNLAVLCEYLGKPSIHMQMRINKSMIDIEKALRGAYQETKQAWTHAVNDLTEQKRLQMEMEGQADYIDEVARNHDMTWDTYLVFSIYADDLKDMQEQKKQLKQVLSMDGFKTFDGLFEQEELYRLCSPIWTTDKLPEILETNYGLPLPSVGMAGLS